MVLVPVAALAAAGCGGGGHAPGSQAASLSVRCSTSSAASSSADLLWLGGSRPAVYFVDHGKVISSRGRGPSLPPSAIPVGFRACRTPLLFYTVGSELRATALTRAHHAGTLTLGSGAVVAPDGRLVSFAGARIWETESVGPSFVARGLPLHWKITGVVASPRDPHVFLASAQSPEAGIETCGKGLGGVYRVSPSGTTTIFIDNPCRDHPQAVWSPDGSVISYVGGSSNDIYVLDASGTHLRRITAAGNVTQYLWSPDGTRIAYTTRRGTAAVVAVAARTTRPLGHGVPLAWSPDGQMVALAAPGRPVIEAVSATGGRARTLLRLPRS